VLILTAALLPLPLARSASTVFEKAHTIEAEWDSLVRMRSAQGPCCSHCIHSTLWMQSYFQALYSVTRLNFLARCQAAAGLCADNCQRVALMWGVPIQFSCIDLHPRRTVIANELLKTYVNKHYGVATVATNLDGAMGIAIPVLDSSSASLREVPSPVFLLRLSSDEKSQVSTRKLITGPCCPIKC
jgi:hypothetical protein